MLPPRRRPPDRDVAISATDRDAIFARLSAVAKGYLVDPYVAHLIPPLQAQPSRSPQHNLGTFLRSTVIDDLVKQWMERCIPARCQIVSLGAGSDTRFWRIAGDAGTRQMLARYIELDLPQVTAKKAMSIRRSKELSDLLGDPAQVTLSKGETALHSEIYHLLPVDLRLPPDEVIEPYTTSPEDAPLLDPTLPTLLLCECVLVYIDPPTSTRLLKWFTQYFSGKEELGCVLYEMFGLDDAFGRMMVHNLTERGVSLPGVVPHPTLKSLEQRFMDTGFTTARAVSLRDVRMRYLSPEERARIGKLELLDEVEELDLVLEHYAVCWGLYMPRSEAQETRADWGLQWIDD